MYFPPLVLKIPSSSMFQVCGEQKRELKKKDKEREKSRRKRKGDYGENMRLLSE
jgi:hypothetical protein